jgi:hypothetical protein
MRIRVLREKKEDTLAAGMEQCDAGVGVEKWKIENGNLRIGNREPKSGSRRAEWRSGHGHPV